MEKQSYPCENCKFRAHYDKNPKSVLGLKDFEADEQGMIPPGLQRGVLSEDALYNLLSDWDGLLTRLAEYANNIRPIQFP